MDCESFGGFLLFTKGYGIIWMWSGENVLSSFENPFKGVSKNGKQKLRRVKVDFDHVRISDVIKRLQAVQAQYGDIIVGTYDDCGLTEFRTGMEVIDIDEGGSEVQKYTEDMKEKTDYVVYTKAVMIY